MSRDHQTSVGGSDYILHIPRPGTEKTYCGRFVSRVNCVDGTGRDEKFEYTCQLCVRARERKP